MRVGGGGLSSRSRLGYRIDLIRLQIPRSSSLAVFLFLFSFLLVSRLRVHVSSRVCSARPSLSLSLSPSLSCTGEEICSGRLREAHRGVRALSMREENLLATQREHGYCVLTAARIKLTTASSANAREKTQPPNHSVISDDAGAPSPSRPPPPPPPPPPLPPVPGRSYE